MDSFLLTLIYRFIIGGTILSGATYLANYTNPLLAGILVTIPLELVSLFFIKEDRLQGYARSILIMSIATVIPVLFFNFIHPLKILSCNLEIAASFCVWILVGAGLFYFMPSEMYDYKKGKKSI
tara:strand:- start:606 stop:977 length:372 start_codon:yes stop_codon:yes gene_type:complete